MSTVSTVRLFQQLRDRILGFTTPDGESPADELGSGVNGRLFYAQAPDDVTTPYVVATLVNQQITMQGSRLRADLELMVYDRPRSRQAAAEHLADWIKGALIGYRDKTSGLVFTNPPTSDSLPPVPSPGDADLVQVRVVAEVVAYPLYLTQYAIPGH